MAHYDSLLIRIWRSNAVDGRQWSIQVLHLQERVQHRFSDPEALIQYLRTVAGIADAAQHAAWLAEAERMEGTRPDGSPPETGR